MNRCDTLLLDPDRAGHLGQGIGIVADGNAGDQDVTDAVPEPCLRAQALIGRELYFALCIPKPWALDGEPALCKGDATGLRSVSAHWAFVLARMFLTSHLLHREHE
jgi:hypothetical protein